MILVGFSEAALKHYCMREMPEFNQALNLDHLSHAVDFLNDRPCELCEEFKKAIKGAITKEAGRRLSDHVLQRRQGGGL